MTERPLRGALVGCGFFARNHLHAWQGLPNVEIAAVCDLDRTKAADAAAAFGIAESFADAAEMLDAVRPDFLDVVTTVPGHRPLVELAASRRVAVICQKPFAETLADALTMVEACAAAGVPLMVHENFRWQRPFLELKQKLDDGRIGRPFFGRLSFRHRYDIYAHQPYLAKIEHLAIMDVGLHVFDLARHLLGDVSGLSCRTQRLNPAVAGEDAFIALLQHESGAVSVVDVSFYTTLHPDPFPETLASIEGSDGTLELLYDYRLRLHRAGAVDGWTVDPPVPPWGERPWHCVQDSVINTQAHFLRCVRGEAEPAPSGRHNLDTLRVALAAYESAANGTSVALAGAG